MKAHADKEDPQAKAEREAEQARADAAYTTNTQGLLTDEMQANIRRYGARTVMSGASGIAPPSGIPGAGGDLASTFRNAFSLITGKSGGS